ncbi:MAG: sodium:proton antiporter NhaD [Bacteroidales bacterium]|nr:sodium:proton antiporter NhaD [Bacteroidales bacterium]
MAVLIIISIIVLGLVLIATESINRMNKAAVAMFMGVICWLLYIGYGTSFVVSEHQIDFLSYLSNHTVSASSVKAFIANSIFFQYIVNAAEVVLFLLGTMTIVEVLNNNGCFDFVQEWLRTRNPRRFLWTLASFTFILSANLDNLTTVCLMLGIMHVMISDDKQRMIFGSVIVVAANCGGAFTVIGDVTSLTIWINGLITPTTYSATVFLPCLAALVTILLLVSHSLPHRLSLARTIPPYRGDDTVLTRPQRLLMLLVGIGGLWFIPTFHRITLLPPFVGALCVLSLLWIVNELCNRSLLSSDQMVNKRQPLALQYISIQHILFFIGLTLAFGAIKETGILERFFEWSTMKLHNIYIIGAAMGFISAVFNNVTTVLANLCVFAPDLVQAHPELNGSFGMDGLFWPLLSYSTAVGSSLLSIGTMAGFALMRIEGVKLRWYVRHISGKIFAGWVVGFFVFYFTAEYFY